MLPEIPPEQLCAVLEELVEERLSAASIEAPPVDAMALAASLELIVAHDRRLEHRARLVRLNYAAGHSRTSILIAPDPREERRHWSVAHEIGEHLAEQACRRLGVRADELAGHGRERLANLMAARILLPGVWFFADARREGWDLVALKAIYCTASHELIARRMLDGKPEIIVSVYDHDRCSWRKSNLPGRLPLPSQSELRCRGKAHQTGEAARQENSRESVIAWPVHEPDWKREIVRAEVLSFDASC